MEICTPTAGADVIEHCVAFNVARVTLAGPPADVNGVVGPLNWVMVGFGGEEDAPTKALWEASRPPLNWLPGAPMTKNPSPIPSNLKRTPVVGIGPG